VGAGCARAKTKTRQAIMTYGRWRVNAFVMLR
jgi:hypothetical protein